MATEINPTRFDVFLGAATVKSEEGELRPLVVVTASSDSVDLGTDRFMLSALKQMAEVFPGMTIFMDHKYSIRDGDVFGSVRSAKIVPRDGHNDLDLEIEVAMSNEKAVNAFKLIEAGIRLGVSVGVLVKEATVSDEKVDGKRVMNITSVEPLEASIVGIPANRRSWAQGALKAASYVLNGGNEMDEEENMEDPELAENLSAVVDTEDSTDAVVDTSNEEEEDPETDDEAADDEDAADDDEVDDDDDLDLDLDFDDDEDPADVVLTPSSAADFSGMPNNGREWYALKMMDGEGNPTNDPASAEGVELRIYDVIGFDWWTGGGITANGIVKTLDALTNVKNITVRINSPGGIIDEAIAIKNALDRSPATVTAYVDGMAASCASFIALGADKLYMSPDSMMMIHDPWSGLMGNAKAFAKEAEVLNKYADTIARIYARKAGGTQQDWRDRMVDETWFSDQEAVDIGLSDGISNGVDTLETKAFPVGMLALYKNAPESAKKFFTAEAPTIKQVSVEVVAKSADTAAISDLSSGITNLTAALRAAQLDNDTIRAEMTEKDTELTTLKTVKASMDADFAEMLALCNTILDTKLLRKTGDAYATKIEQFATKYPWLDSRITSALARSDIQPK